MSDDLEYWRELAAQYQRELEALRARVLRYLESPEVENAAALLCATQARPGWMQEIDRIDVEIKQTDAKSALDSLWSRVATDE
ncbi:MAG: hypothetical protein DMF56_18835 [Acidobacteria bacterium]|nr:MAG: hypothetical protein DMF56_18835 [Acidobacteriota bacterium]